MVRRGNSARGLHGCAREECFRRFGARGIGKWSDLTSDGEVRRVTIVRM